MRLIPNRFIKLKMTFILPLLGSQPFQRPTASSKNLYSLWVSPKKKEKVSFSTCSWHSNPKFQNQLGKILLFFLFILLWARHESITILQLIGFKFVEQKKYLVCVYLAPQVSCKLNRNTQFLLLTLYLIIKQIEKRMDVPVQDNNLTNISVKLKKFIRL